MSSLLGLLIKLPLLCGDGLAPYALVFSVLGTLRIVPGPGPKADAFSDDLGTSGIPGAAAVPL